MGSAPPGEELCLRWNDFESILSRSFNEMRQESDFFDVKIACFDDKSVMKTIPAHKVVLSACSPVFKEILRAMTEKNPLIFLRGISYHEMEAVLDFMYNGQTKVQHTDLDAFLAAAEDLKVKGLTTSGSNKVEPSPEPSTSRKRAAVAEATPDSKKAKKVSIASKPAPMDSIVKSEPEKYSEEVDVDLADLGEDSYQDYEGAEGDLEGYDESSYQEDGAGNDFPSDNKGNLPVFYSKPWREFHVSTFFNYGSLGYFAENEKLRCFSSSFCLIYHDIFHAQEIGKMIFCAWLKRARSCSKSAS